MNYVNNATLIRRELITRLSTLFVSKKLDNLERIPLELFPRGGTSVRCCIYKDRAMIRYRLMALMGHRVEDETDELKSLKDYAKDALNREKPQNPFLTVIGEACSACVRVNYVVTDACQGCVARPCMLNCPKEAIEFVNGRAHIMHDKCINCGICQKECPYHAIIYMPVPCEEACPVDAIRKDDSGKEEIDYDKCTYCGKCMRACPFGAIMERSQLMDVLKALESNRRCVAMIAPSLVGQFSASLGRVVTALKKLGFDDVTEVAGGAMETANHEAHEWESRMAQEDTFMTTSCCPAWVETVNKHLPDLKPYVSKTATPLHYTGERVRKNDPEAVTVFIGPCVSKRHEAWKDDTVDLVLSIEELGALFVALKIDVQKMDEAVLEDVSPAGRGFAVTGGVTEAVRKNVTNHTMKTVQIDGLDKQSLREIRRYPKQCPGNFVEVMSCQGGCIAGPNVINNPRLALRQLKKILNQSNP
ncbi:MAG: 4Fe-4S dicluster domain-containing protein [Candidatus Marinimicrobia bacterium]|nr:4Fe-4S dicluster domain-containing protein [Candidatus Neomarinimicrobiota bacterium]